MRLLFKFNHYESAPDHKLGHVRRRLYIGMSTVVRVFFSVTLLFGVEQLTTVDC